MAKVILGVTGSVAAIRTPMLAASLKERGHQVRVVATEPSLYFFEASDLIASGVALFRDQDEWSGTRYQRDDTVLHIEFRKWADVLLVAPLDANTLGKFAHGLCDNFLTCIYRAWDFEKPVILAPAMNTFMWQSPVTLRHLKLLLQDYGDHQVPDHWTLEEAEGVFVRYGRRLVLIPPQSKRLACGDVGVGAMAEVNTIADEVRRWVMALDSG